MIAPDAATSSSERAAAESRGRLPIDHCVLARLLCNDRIAQKQVLRTFLDAWPGDLLRLREALDGAGSPEGRTDAARFAHRMKGACRIVGANPLAEACERAESMLGEGDSMRVASAISELSAEATRTAAYLRDWLDKDD